MYKGLRLALAVPTLLALVALCPAERRALLISVENYGPGIRPFEAAKADVDAIALTLVQTAGFKKPDVQVLHAPDRAALLRGLHKFKSQVQPGDMALFSFFGHGLFIDGRTYLAAKDANFASDTTIAQSCVSDSEIRDILEVMPAEMLVSLYDISRDPPKGAGRNSLALGQARKLVISPGAPQKTPQNTITLFSCMKGERSWVWKDKKRGYFSYFLEQAFKDGAADASGTVRVTGLVRYLKKAVGGVVTQHLDEYQDPYEEIRGEAAEEFELASKRPPGTEGETLKFLSSAFDKAYFDGQYFYLKEAEEEALDKFKQALAIKPDPHAAMYAGWCCYAQRDFEQAGRYFRMAADLNPNSVSVATALGFYLAEQERDYDRAAKLFEKSIKLDPDYSHPVFMVARLKQISLKDYEGAVEYYRKGLALEDSNAWIYTSFGTIMRDRGNIEEAERLFRRGIEIDPEEPGPVNHLALLNSDFLHNMTEAKRLYRRALELNPKDAYAHYGLATAIIELDHDYKQAERLLRTSMDLNPNLIYPISSMGDLKMDMGDYQEAEKYYRQAIKSNANFSRPYDGLARIKFDQGDWAEAERLFRRAITLPPRLAGPYNGLGDILLFGEKKDYAEAEKMFLKGHEIDPNVYYPLHQLGTLKYEVGDYEAAERYYRKAIAVQPGVPEPLNALGNTIYVSKGAYDEAEKLFRQAIELDPTFANPYNGLGNVMVKKEKLDEAEEFYKKAAELDPSLGNVWNGLGNVMYLRKNYREAEKNYEKAVSMMPGEAGPLGGLANARGKLGRLVDAENLYKEALEIKPDDSMLWANLAENLLAQGKRREAEEAAGKARSLGLAEHKVFRQLDGTEPISKPKNNMPLIAGIVVLVGSIGMLLGLRLAKARKRALVG